MPGKKPNSIFLRFSDILIHDSYKTDKFLYGKVQSYILCLVVVTVSGLLITFLSKFIVAPTPNADISILMSALCILINFIALFLLRYPDTLRLSYTIASIDSLIVLDTITYDSGGIYSTTILWTMLIPIGAYLLLSTQMGKIWSAIVVLNIFIFYAIDDFMGIDLKNRMDIAVLRTIDSAFVFSGILVIVYLYERGKNNLTDRLIKNNEEIASRNETLDLLNKEKENLMSIVAHDLKAPIKTVSGYLNFISIAGELNEKQELCVDASKAVLVRANKLISDLLYFHEVSEIDLSHTKENINLTNLTSEVVSGHQNIALEKRIVIHSTFELNNNDVYTYPGLLARIIDNLVSNAIKFSPFDKNIYIRLFNDENKVCISVRDEGPGISLEEQKKLFIRFQKLSARPTNQESSNGLGLAIVKSLVDIMNGQIKVNSEKNKGAEFVVSMPISSEEKQQSMTA